MRVRNLESRSVDGHLAAMHFCFLPVQDSPVSLPPLVPSSLPSSPSKPCILSLHLPVQPLARHSFCITLLPPSPSLLPSPPLFQQRARTSALVFSIRSSYMPPTTDCLPERMQATFHAASLLFHSFVSPARQRSSSDTKLARKFHFDNEIPISAYLTSHEVRFYGGCYLGRRGSQRMVFIMSERPSAPLAQFLMLT